MAMPESAGAALPAGGGEAPSLPAWRWRLNRLRCMGAAEIGHRLWRALRIAAESRGLWPAAAATPPDLSIAPAAWIVPPAGIDASAILAAADRLLTGRHSVFALADVDLGSPPDWNRDPKTGITAPLVFGKRLDYRDPRLVGDIKYLWEPNRHLHLVTLAQAWRLSGEARYAEAIGTHLASWFAACPPGRGANWSSSLEAGLRLISWSLVWQLLGGAVAPLFQGAAGGRLRTDWLDSVREHAEFILGHLSLHSSANNHLIGEVAGLYVAALTWPHWPRARRWRGRAKAILEREARRQNAADGVNREQAVAYQQFELELLLLPFFAARAQGDDFSPGYVATIERLLEFLASLMDVGGHLPMFGDADDGAALRLDPRADFAVARSLLATGAVLFGRADFKAKAGPADAPLDEQSCWLLDADAAARFAALPPPATPLPVRRSFPEGGYYILGCDFERADEIRLVADAGPLGYLGIAAHGHADALSFTLSLGGCEFLVDPGTFAYHTEGEWRAYFRGTAAHNTVRVDGRDQSEPGGNFLWLAKAQAEGRLLGDDVFEGEHDGYRRLPDPVRHRRRIAFDRAARRFTIDDALAMRGEHRIELFFHFAEACRLRPGDGDGEYVAERDGRRLRLRLPPLAGARHEILYGSTQPIAGWVSRRFDRKVAAPTLRWQATASGDLHLRSELRCSDPSGD